MAAVTSTWVTGSAILPLPFLTGNHSACTALTLHWNIRSSDSEKAYPLYQLDPDLLPPAAGAEPRKPAPDGKVHSRRFRRFPGRSAWQYIRSHARQPAEEI